MCMHLQTTHCKTFIDGEAEKMPHCSFLLSLHHYAGDPPGYQFTHFSGQATTAFTSDLPHLTGEDLKMLDVFSEQIRGEDGQFVQLHSQQATLNYSGAGTMLQ